MGAVGGEYVNGVDHGGGKCAWEWTIGHTLGVEGELTGKGRAKVCAAQRVTGHAGNPILSEGIICEIGEGIGLGGVFEEV